MHDENIQEGVPSSFESAPSASDAPEEEWLVYCPRCLCPTESLKTRNLTKVAFFLAAVAWGHERVIGCPPCTRAAIVKQTLLAIFLSNLLFPILAIFYLLQWATTFSDGHSNVPDAEANRHSPEWRIRNFDAATTSHGIASDPFLRYVFRMIAMVVIGLIAVILIGVLIAWLSR